MKDIVLVFQILNVCSDSLANVPAYEEPMSALLHLCRLPYLKEKTSDETSYEQMAIECTEQLGLLILSLFAVPVDNWWTFSDQSIYSLRKAEPCSLSKVILLGHENIV